MSQQRERQYQISEGGYFPCGMTRQSVPPGFYDVKRGMSGYSLSPRTLVSDELIDIPGTVADDVFLDIEQFLASKAEYARYALTHKRGYLFYGPQGSGKTSIGLMIANRFVQRVGGVVMYAGGYHEFVGGVSVMRDVEPGRPSLYLIEEAEEIADYTECLSILDGELSIQGAVFVAMTNYKDKLPPRLTNRPGRFDRVVLVDCPPAPVQVEYLRRVEARVGENPDAPQRIVQALEGLPVSMAHLREAFIAHVLMNLPLTEVRARFEQMAGVKNDDEDDDDEGNKSESCPCDLCPGHDGD